MAGRVPSRRPLKQRIVRGVARLRHRAAVRKEFNRIEGEPAFVNALTLLETGERLTKKRENLRTAVRNVRDGTKAKKRQMEQASADRAWRKTPEGRAAALRLAREKKVYALASRFGYVGTERDPLIVELLKHHNPDLKLATALVRRREAEGKLRRDD